MQQFQSHIRILLGILMILFGFISSGFPQENNLPSEISPGYFGFSNAGFDEESVYKIDGKWEFYANHIYYPADFLSNSIGPDTFLFQPSLWNDLPLKGKALSNLGSGTYRARFIDLPKNQLMGVYIAYQASSSVLFVNGKEIGRSGIPSETKEQWKAGVVPIYTYFQTDKDTTEVVVQIANFDHRDGGWWHSFKMGSKEAIQATHQKNLLFDLLLLGFIFAIFVYHVALWIIDRSDIVSALFAAFCFIICIRIGITGEHLYIQWLDENIPFAWHKKVEFVTTYFMCFIIIDFLYKLYEGIGKKWVLYFFGMYSSVFILLTMFTSPEFGSVLVLYFQFIVPVLFITGYFLLITAIRQKRVGAWLLLTGLSLFFVAAVNDILYTQVIVRTGYFIPLGLAIFVLFFSIVISINIFKVRQRKNELEETQKTIGLINTINEDIASNISIAEVMDTVYSKLNQLMPAELFGIGIYNMEKNVLSFPALMINGAKSDQLNLTVKEDSDHLAVQCFNQDKSLVFNHGEGKKANDKSDYQISVLQSLIYVPLKTEKRKVGVITVQSEQTEAYLPFHENVLESIANYAAIAIENALSFEHIEEQKEVIEKSHLSITSSINYAQKIQKALLPPEKEMLNMMSDRMVLWIPRDVVSGDFYWGKQSQGFTYIACADCTGHGVPGAFMSALGISIFNNLSKTAWGKESSFWLNEARDRIKEALEQQVEKSKTRKDGMDVSLVRWDETKNTLQFSSANSSLLVFRKKELDDTHSEHIRLKNQMEGGFAYLFKGQRQPIGTYRKETPFLHIDIPLEKGDRIFMFTDGITDQMNHEGIKYQTNHFMDFISGISTLQMAEIQTRIEDEFNSWKTGFRQLDDVLVMGFEI